MTDPMIKVRGAREHNLRNISLDIPRNKLVVITGPSGSGKSSLAFSTIYAEGQRRYVESLSAYARQFLELMDKPDVDLIEGLSPAIAIEQRSPSHNPRSTVATVTEIYDYLRLLFARAGRPHCPNCHRLIRPQSASNIIQDIARAFAGRNVQLLAPLVLGRTGTYEELFARLKKQGYARVRVDGQIRELDSAIKLDRYKKHTIDAVIDRLAVTAAARQRLADSAETALKESKGLILVAPADDGKKGDVLYSERFACPDCGLSLPEVEPRLFSFNSPHGACPSCDGLGVKLEIAEDLVIPDEQLSVTEGALAAWSNPVTTRTHRWKSSWAGYYDEILKEVCRRHKIPMDKPWKSLSKEERRILLHGGVEHKSPWGRSEKIFEGVIGNLERRYKESESDFVKEEVRERFMRSRLCPDCRGARLKPAALAVTVADKSVQDVVRMSVRQARDFFAGLSLEGREQAVAKPVLKEIRERLTFLVDVGLDYVTLDRESATLAGGEAQRIHLATQIGSGLVGVMYVLDEPTIGLHPRDNDRLLGTLKRLRDLGNTLIVVEHDEATIRAADWIVDLGPGAGVHGGQITFSGALPDLLKAESLTADYLRGDRRIEIPGERKSPDGRFLEVLGAAEHNLKNIDVKIPLGLFVAVTGVSGSGKSTLVDDVLRKALSKKIHGAKEEPGRHRAIKGVEHVDKVVLVDQTPIGRTPRSNPATYTGAFGPIRDLFAQLPESRRRGYKPGRFSFNVKGGRCEECQGEGVITTQLYFMPDVEVTCGVCKGARFGAETLEVTLRGKTITDVLNMPVEEGVAFFAAEPVVSRKIEVLKDLGLGYLTLGQSATTLSGGEAQRIKIAAELSKLQRSKHAVYILDEPTTGLHLADVERLLECLQRLVDAGHTVLVIEHHLDVIKTADHVIDLGPEGGHAGGEVVVTGTPEQVAACKESHTGRFLKRRLRE